MKNEKQEKLVNVLGELEAEILKLSRARAKASAALAELDDLRWTVLKTLGRFHSEPEIELGVDLPKLRRQVLALTSPDAIGCDHCRDGRGFAAEGVCPECDAEWLK